MLTMKSRHLPSSVVCLLLLTASCCCLGQVESQRRITTPKEALGFNIGDDFHMANYVQLTAYWQRLAKESDRMKLVDIGPTAEGRRQYMAIISSPENIGPGFIFERPKVFYNAKTKKYVMYVHLDAPGYKLAKVAVLTSDKVDGNYSYIKSFRPLDQESRDIGQFIDDDGSAYLIFESRPTKGFFIAKLSDDYLTVEKQVAFIQAPLEGGAIVHYKGLYYVVGSHMTGWRPNPNVYATAPALTGPWTEFKNLAPAEANNYDSQSTMLLKVTGSKTTLVLFMGDLWRPKALWDSRYFWMPLQMSNGTMELPPPQPWTLNPKTGETTLQPNTPKPSLSPQGSLP